MNEQEETIKKAKVMESLAPTRLERHIATTSTGSGTGGATSSGSNDWTPGTVIFGPPPPPALSRSLLDYFRRPTRTEQATNRSNQGVQTMATSIESQGVQTAQTSSASQGVQTSPRITQLFNLYDDDKEEDGGLGATVTDALDQYQKLEAERLAALAQQAHVHLDSITSQTLPIAHESAARRQASEEMRAILRNKREEFKRLKAHRTPDVSPTPPTPPNEPIATASPAAPPTVQIGGSSSSAAAIPSQENRGRPKHQDEIPNFSSKKATTILGNWKLPELRQQLKLRGISPDVTTTKADMIKALMEFDREVNSSSGSSSGGDARGKSQRARAVSSFKKSGKITGLK